jgi:hypothetical protein
MIICVSRIVDNTCYQSINHKNNVHYEHVHHLSEIHDLLLLYDLIRPVRLLIIVTEPHQFDPNSMDLALTFLPCAVCTERNFKH